MNRFLNQYNLKSAKELIKDISLDKREVAVYLSKFNNIDSDNDIIRKGAFEKSLRERGPNSASNRKIAFLRYHDWQHQIGKFTSIEEDSIGLFAVGKLGSSTKGEDALRDYEEGIITEHSIGFQYLSDGTNWIEDSTKSEGGYFEISEVKLFEGSAVTFGANEQTNVIGVSKGLNKVEAIEDITKQINIVTKALINGRGTDERLFDLEMKLKFLNARLIDLAMNDPELSPKSELIEQINIKPTFNWAKINNLLETKESYSDYPKQAVDNAKKGIELNLAVNNDCATAVGKQRAQDIANRRPLSVSTIERTFSYLSRAEEYYDPNDTKACGTISYLLWGGKSMKTWSENKLKELNN